MGSKQLIAVDADVLVYNVGFGCETTLDFDDDWATLTADKRHCAELLEAEVSTITKKLGRGDVIMCLSDLNHNFRKDVLPTYKGNRGGGRTRPILFHWIREWFSQNYRTECWAGLEADDVMGILMTQQNAIAVTIDKDLKTIPGRTANPSDDYEVVTTAEAEAFRFFLEQVLTGDRVDNYLGCPGIGPKTAEKILLEGTWEEVVGAYEKAKLTEADALVQARCARILQDGDYDKATGEVKLWTPK